MSGSRPPQPNSFFLLEALKSYIGSLPAVIRTLKSESLLAALKYQNKQYIIHNDPGPFNSHDELHAEVLLWVDKIMISEDLRCRFKWLRLYIGEQVWKSDNLLEKFPSGESSSSVSIEHTCVHPISSHTVLSVVLSCVFNLLESITFSPEIQAFVTKMTNCCVINEVSIATDKNVGKRMEDYSIQFHVLPESLTKVGLYAIFDGHNGYHAAEFASFILPVIVAQYILNRTDPVSALSLALADVNEKFLNRAKHIAIQSGCTAVCCLVTTSHAHISWLGDSLGVLIRDSHPTLLTPPHNPDNKSEKERIEKAGGYVQMPTEPNSMVPARVNGFLAVSRSIGDVSFKPDLVTSDHDSVGFSHQACTRFTGLLTLDSNDISEEGHQSTETSTLPQYSPRARGRSLHETTVTTASYHPSSPRLQQQQHHKSCNKAASPQDFTSPSTTEILILASDGVWDVWSSDHLDITRFIYHLLKVERICPKDVARRIIDESKRKGSTDNAACQVLFFRDPNDCFRRPPPLPANLQPGTDPYRLSSPFGGSEDDIFGSSCVISAPVSPSKRPHTTISSTSDAILASSENTSPRNSGCAL